MPAGQLVESTQEPLLRKLVEQAVQFVAEPRQVEQGRVQLKQNRPEENLPVGHDDAQMLS